MDKYQTFADEILNTAQKAYRKFLQMDQESTDKVVKAAFAAAYDARITLAQEAFEETGMGVVSDKIQKNAWASIILYDTIKNKRTVGIVSEDEYRGLTAIAHPRGPILSFTPVTNPTSTAIFKILISLKTRNPLIISPHRRAKKCTLHTAELMYEAALQAGAPEGCIQWVSKSRNDYVNAVMLHPSLSMIIATGAGNIVKVAQASGKPTLGVGTGNVPVYIHKSADFALAAESIFLSKTFDNGTVCASEQAVMVEPEVDARIRTLLERKGAWFCSRKEAEKIGEIAFDMIAGTMKPGVVGQSAEKIAGMAGLKAPKGTKLIIAEQDDIGPEFPLAHEVLAPVLAWYVVSDSEQARAYCRKICNLGGEGHTLSLFTNRDDMVEEFAEGATAGRIILNQPSTHGAIGGIYNSLDTSFTLSCGTGGGNITMDNISISHLLEYQKIARLRHNYRWMNLPEGVIDSPSLGSTAILSIYGRNF